MKGPLGSRIRSMFFGVKPPVKYSPPYGSHFNAATPGQDGLQGVFVRKSAKRYLECVIEDVVVSVSEDVFENVRDTLPASDPYAVAKSSMVCRHRSSVLLYSAMTEPFLLCDRIWSEEIRKG